MPVEIRYQPPAVNPIVALAAVKSIAEVAGAEVWLEASQPLVPVDTGELKASGKVTPGPHGAELSYTRVGADGYNVAARMHEDMTLNHPGGGQAKFVEQPGETHAAEILAATGLVIARIL